MIGGVYCGPFRRTDIARILVTGAAGFIGSHLSERLLDDGHEVIGFDSFVAVGSRRRAESIATRRPGFRLVEGDIRDAAAVDRGLAEHAPETVVHLAALAGVRPSVERPAEFADVNVHGTANVLAASVAAGVRHVVFGSSSSVYGENAKVPFAEDDPVTSPVSPYAATKVAGELLARTFWHLHDLPVTCLRFFTVYGPRQRPDLAIAKFMRLMAEGRPIPVFGDGGTSRDYTFVADIVEGVCAAIERRAGFSIYNLGSDRPIALRDLIAEIERATGRRAEIDRQPTQPGDVSRTWADLTRASRELGYRPRTDLREGLTAQWDWFVRSAS